ncbi:MAG: polysaccharide deacetylase [Oscillospiraceae bacterium]|nr:polysaccharide deacetylase [Oscillospiraceae bacterium]
MRWITGSLALTILLICTVFSFQKTPAACRAEDLIPPAAAVAATDAAAVSEKTVYLTFDDGPSQNTASILDTLKEAGVPATFFVVSAENNEEFLPLLERTLAEGHCIGLHSCTHDYRKIYANTDAFWADIDALREKLQPYCGDASYPVLRFPGGSSNTVSHKYGGSGLMEELIRQAREQGYAVVDWNVTAEDSVGGNPSAATIASRVIRGCKEQNTAIVLMHDSSTNQATAEALPTIIRWLQENSYRFDTVDHLPQD